MAVYTQFQGNRMYSGPMDSSLVFATKESMNSYASNGTAYAGMIVGCKEDNSAYILNAGKTAFIKLNGATGVAGKDGLTPSIGGNGNWYLGTVDTGVKAQGPEGEISGIKLNGVLVEDVDGVVDIVLEVSNIPDLPASKITSETFSVDRIPALSADKITSDVLGVARIPNLSADKITSDELNVNRIPTLPQSKITGLETALTDVAYLDDIPTIPTISTDVESDGASDEKTASPKAVKTYVDGKISSVYKFGGTLASAGIVAGLLVEGNEGKVYNISEDFTTTSNFVEGADVEHSAGTNIVVVDTGGETYKFDVFSGQSGGIQSLGTYATEALFFAGLFDSDVEDGIYTAVITNNEYVADAKTRALAVMQTDATEAYRSAHVTYTGNIGAFTKNALYNISTTTVTKDLPITYNILNANYSEEDVLDYISTISLDDLTDPPVITTNIDNESCYVIYKKSGTTLYAMFYFADRIKKVAYNLSTSTITTSRDILESVDFVTSCPTGNNTDGGLKFVVTSTACVTKYTGWHYIVTTALTASRALVTDANGNIQASDITATELGYLDNVTSNVQTQIDSKADLAPSTNTEDANYTLALTDAGKVILAGHATNAVKITIPLNSAVEFPTNTEIAVVRYLAGVVTIGTSDGATLNGEDYTTTFDLGDQYTSVAIKKVGTDAWIMTGNFEETA